MVVVLEVVVVADVVDEEYLPDKLVLFCLFSSTVVFGNLSTPPRCKLELPLIPLEYNNEVAALTLALAKF
jgi:hypothetical protein